MSDSDQGGGPGKPTQHADYAKRVLGSEARRLEGEAVAHEDRARDLIERAQVALADARKTRAHLDELRRGANIINTFV